MRHLAQATAWIILLAAQVLSAQQKQPPMKPTAPGTSGDPAWQAIVRLGDGRTFVTDGGLAIDVTVAKLGKLPEREVPGKVIENYLGAPHQDEYSFSDLSADPNGRTYTTPRGIPLNATYVDYLRRILPVRSVRFRMNKELEPVVILVETKAVGVLMPVQK